MRMVCWQIAFIPNRYNQSAGRTYWLWFPVGWYPAGATLIVNALIGDIFVICILVDTIRPQDLFVKYILAPAAKTQGRMNELFSIRTAQRLQPPPTTAAPPTTAVSPVSRHGSRPVSCHCTRRTPRHHHQSAHSPRCYCHTAIQPGATRRFSWLSSRRHHALDALATAQ
jgi:hypothetical protein